MRRIQIAIYHRLVAESVGPKEEIDFFWANWVNSRAKQGFDLGGAVIQLASLPRTWDVPVGGEIKHD